MFPEYHQLTPLVDRSPVPDRRPLPSANEIRMRVKRAAARRRPEMPEHTFHTPLPLTLEVAIPAGDIDVETVDGEETHLVVDAEERLLENLEVRHDGDRVSVALRGKSKIGLSFSLGSLMFGNDGITVRARVPHGVDGAGEDGLRGRRPRGTAAQSRRELGLRRPARPRRGGRGREGQERERRRPARERRRGSLREQRLGRRARGPYRRRRRAQVGVRRHAGRGLIAGDVRFTSVSGDVEFGIAQGSLLDVDAGSTSGDLSSEVPLASAPSEGGDGPTVTVRGKTISGDVRVFRAAWCGGSSPTATPVCSSRADAVGLRRLGDVDRDGRLDEDADRIGAPRRPRLLRRSGSAASRRRSAACSRTACGAGR